MRVLGIDPGLVRTGYGVVEARQGAYHLVGQGLVRTSAKEGLPQRLAAIYEGVAAAVRGFEPEAVAVEALYFARNAQTSFLLGQARGAAIMAAVHGQVPLFEYPPARVKQAVVGRGGADKEQVAAMVRVVLRRPDLKVVADVTDALAVAICHLNARRHQALIGRAAGR